MAAASQALATLDDPREARFVELYVETSNGKQSAIAAGFGVKGAHTKAHQLLKRSYIKEAIAKRNAEYMTELDFSPARIIREYAKVAGVNSADFISIDEEDGTPHIDFSRVTRRQMAAISSVTRTDKGVSYKTHDKLKALDALAKIAQLFPAERLEHTGANGGPIVTANLHKIDIEALDHDQRAQLKQTLLMLTQKPNENE